jgi:hypothetical protein
LNEQDRKPGLAKGDAAFALAMMAVALTVMWGLRHQPKAPYDPVGAAAVPFWTAAIVLALAAFLLVRVLLRRATRGDAQALFTANEAIDDSYDVVPSFSVWAVALSILYIAVMPLVGFMASSIVYMLALGWVLSDRTPRAMAILACVAVVLGAGIDLGFRAMLIDLP